MRAIVLFFLVSGMLTACGGADNSDKKGSNTEVKLQIISSIKPVQAIVLAIAGGHAQSEQIIPDYASPHNYSFKPSDIRKVKKADVIFRIDDHLESQLSGVFESLDSKTKLITLADANGLTLIDSDGSHHDHTDHQDSSHQDSNHQDAGHQEKHSSNKHDVHEDTDLHIWTSPKNAIIIAKVVTETLSELDANNAKSYQQNYEQFSEQLKVESDRISQRLAKHQGNQYIVFHNSWKYFAEEFGLQKPTVVDLHEDVSSGARTISDIRNKIDKEKIRCVFYDSSVSEARLKLLTERPNTKPLSTIEIDVLAKGIEPNQSSYINWLSQFANKVDGCLDSD